ncbi:MAG: glycoside hydrolase family 3 N-terminal domain-containing protein [Bacteroidota bacterium]|nr:glycoside hydrolase family 3 N-terminal domain-containing protein [Bacteroidota bacterium]
MRRLLPICFLIILTANNTFSQTLLIKQISQNDQNIETGWVDSVYSKLTQEERIGQLFMIRSYANPDSNYYREIESQIRKYNVGGICFFSGTPWAQAMLTNRYQSLSKTPLFISIDGEWGLGMRLDSTVAFPRQMVLGAIQNDSLIYAMGLEIGRQMRRIGVNINFAPVVDINNNPKNPVINNRSFGEDKFKVTSLALAYMRGLQDQGIIAVAKHFPGHGDTDIDSHIALPVINHDKKTIEDIDLYPFRKLINQGIAGIMVAHLHVPALDSIPHSISTISKPIITDLLKGELGFKGLVFTDAMEMKGLADNVDPKLAEVKALLAGNDVLLLPVELPRAIQNVKEALDKGIISQQLIEEKCRKILTYKYKTGLNKLKPVELKNLMSDISSPEASEIVQNLVASAVTIAKNKENLLPLKTDNPNLAIVCFGDSTVNDFQKSVRLFTPADHYYLPVDISGLSNGLLMPKLSTYKVVAIDVRKTVDSPKHEYGIRKQLLQFIDSLSKSGVKIIVHLPANAYALAQFDMKNVDAMVMTYRDRPNVGYWAAQAMFGAIPTTGRLPVSASKDFPVGTGIKQEATRLGFAPPETVGIDPRDLTPIDSLVMNGFSAKAFPGCRILVAVDNKIIFDKAYGYQTYDKQRRVEMNDIYDLASVTKVAATTLALMKLSEEGKIDVSKKIDYYLPDYKKSNKKGIRLDEILAHQARLQPFIPFYEKTLAPQFPNPVYYSTVPTKKFGVRVTDKLWLRNDYRDTIFDIVKKSPLLEKTEYKYSDLSMYLMYQVIERVTNQKFEDYIRDTIYKPLDLNTIGFNPLDRFNIERIPPTENDTIFRHQLVHGYVHDPGAAMMGGVMGHAGLFSDVYDLAAIMQMLINGGRYNGIQLFNPETIDQFTKYHFSPLNRRGLGWDKQLFDPNINGPCCVSASDESFGHSGFTGTFVWADPRYKMVYIFLSNRIYPDAGNNKISEMNIRTNIQQVVYDALQKAESRKEQYSGSLKEKRTVYSVN